MALIWICPIALIRCFQSVPLIEPLRQDEWYFTSHWLIALKCYILYSFLIAKKPHALLVHRLGFTAKKKQFFLQFLQIFWSDYSFVCNLPFLFSICPQFSPAPLFYCLWIFGAARFDHRGALPVYPGRCLDIRLSSMSLVAWLYVKTSSLARK